MDDQPKKELAMELMGHLDEILIGNEEWWMHGLQFLLEFLQTHNVEFEQLLGAMLLRDYMGINVQADMSVAKQMIKLTSPQGNETIDPEFQSEFHQSVPYCVKVVESLYPHAQNVTQTLFGTGVDLNTVDNDSFRKAATEMKTNFPLAFQVFSACCQQGGRFEICKLVTFALSVIVFSSKADLLTDKEKKKKIKKGRPLIEAPRPQPKQKVLFDVTIDVNKNVTIVAKENLGIGDQIVLQWQYTVEFNPDGSLKTAKYKTLQIRIIEDLTDEMLHVMTSMFKPDLIQYPQKKKRGLELPSQTSAVTIVVPDGGSFAVEIGPCGVDPDLLCAMFNANSVYLLDLETRVYTPLTNVRAGKTYAIGGTPVVDLACGTAGRLQTPSKAAAKTPTKKAAKPVNAATYLRQEIREELAPVPSSSLGSDSWRTESAMHFVDAVMSDGSASDLLKIVCQWTQMRSSGQLGQSEKYIRCLESAGIATVDQLRAAPQSQLDQVNIPIGLKNHLLSSI